VYFCASSNSASFTSRHSSCKTSLPKTRMFSWAHFCRVSVITLSWDAASIRSINRFDFHDLPSPLFIGFPVARMSAIAHCQLWSITSALPEPQTARSGLPSLLKSPTSSCRLLHDAKEKSWNPPCPSFVNTVTSWEFKKPIAISGFPSTLKSLEIILLIWSGNESVP